MNVLKSLREGKKIRSYISGYCRDIIERRKERQPIAEVTERIPHKSETRQATRVLYDRSNKVINSLFTCSFIAHRARSCSWTYPRTLDTDIRVAWTKIQR